MQAAGFTDSAKTHRDHGHVTAKAPLGTSQVCWICGSDNTAEWKERSAGTTLRPEDFRITDSHYGRTLALRKCRQCRFIFAEGDDLERLTALYEQLTDAEYEETQDTRLLQFRWLLDNAQRDAPAARTLLDIGAGVGLLVSEARRRGLEAVGVEPSRSLAAAAQSINSADLLQGVFPHPALAGRRFDIICLIDIIEHVAQPVEMLRDCAKALSPGGVIVIVTPDVESIPARVLGRRWWHFRVAHVGYFSRSSLDRAMRAAGLEPVRWFRAKWFFRAGYLAQRITEYLPLRGLNRWAQRQRMLTSLYNRVVPLNLHDSWVVIGRGTSGSGEP
jgi:2-polyprenyl-3-methyl-5-hydroxy-6-metoxy-1,4-benzoquinol methylase